MTSTPNRGTDGNVVKLRRHSIDGDSSHRVRNDADPWSTDDLAYSQSNIYVRSTDQHGQSTTIRSALPPALHAEIKALIESGAIPEYRTISDFVRDAVHHRMHWILERVDDGTIKRRMTDVMRIAEVERIAGDTDTQVHYVATISDSFHRIRISGDWGMLRSLIDDIRQHASSGDIRDPYRQQVQWICDTYESFADNEDVATPAALNPD